MIESCSVIDVVVYNIKEHNVDDGFWAAMHGRFRELISRYCMIFLFGKKLSQVFTSQSYTNFNLCLKIAKLGF